MATEKEMNQASFAKISKELNAFAEVIRSRQDQKQVIIDDFNKERRSYHAGKIAKRSLASSIPRVRKELQRLNNEIRKNIRNLNSTAEKAKKFSARQSPKNFIVSMSGITLSGGKKKKKHRAHKRAKTHRKSTKKRKRR